MDIDLDLNRPEFRKLIYKTGSKESYQHLISSPTAHIKTITPINAPKTKTNLELIELSLAPLTGTLLGSGLGVGLGWV